MASKVAKAFSLICGIEGGDENILVDKETSVKTKEWFETQGNDRVVLLKDLDGNISGVQIHLGNRMCLHYHNKGSCHPPSGCCSLWHICKRFVEGDCSKGECNRSHDFHDAHNILKTKELALQNVSNEIVAKIVRYSLPQVCLRYLEGKCRSDECPYCHICANVIRQRVCDAHCALSHNFADGDGHNETVLKRFGFGNLMLSNSQIQVDFMHCNILVPTEQKTNQSKTKDSLQPCAKCKIPAGTRALHNGIGENKATELASAKDDLPIQPKYKRKLNVL